LEFAATSNDLGPDNVQRQDLGIVNEGSVMDFEEPYTGNADFQVNDTEFQDFQVQDFQYDPAIAGPEGILPEAHEWDSDGFDA